MTKHKSIAVDGPSGAGKSTLAKLLARRLGFLYVDTGAIYRTVGLRAYRAGVDPEDALNAACEKFIRRYGAVEQGARDRGVSVSDLTLEEMTGLWNAAK